MANNLETEEQDFPADSPDGRKHSKLMYLYMVSPSPPLIIYIKLENMLLTNVFLHEEGILNTF